MKRTLTALVGAGALTLAAAVIPALPASADAPSGAIFTTLPDGSEVNFNIYPSKDAVYLDGGPGPGAPQGAAGLDDGTYVFQITDPSGKVLLSTDPARCRQFTVVGGIITGVVAQPDGCEHVTGLDVDHGATTVQMMPYLDTPNNGGEYKAWATMVADFLAGCAEFGVANGLDVVDCGNTGGNRHGFVGSDSKTDNFKVGPEVPQEIDTRFFRNGELLDGLGVTWTDTHGATNRKWSYYAPQLSVYHEAHVENVEPGTHTIGIANQTGCAVKAIRTGGKTVANGPAAVAVKVTSTTRSFTVFIDVTCG